VRSLAEKDPTISVSPRRLLYHKFRGLVGDAGESSMLVDGELGSRKRHGAHKPRHKPSIGSSGNGEPLSAFLYALSVQALAVTTRFNLDYLCMSASGRRGDNSHGENEIHVLEKLCSY
jgi:hypothetical protein